MSEPVSARVLARLNELLDEEGVWRRDDVTRQAQWNCEDGIVVTYATSDGKFLVQLHRPVGKAARSGSSQEWQDAWRRRRLSTR